MAAREFRALGTVWKAGTSAVEVRASISVTDGTTTRTYNSSFNTIAASTVYRLPDLMHRVAFQLQDWIYDQLVADASITTKPSAASAIDVDLAWPATTSASANGNKLTLTVGPDLGGAQIGGVNVTVSAFTATNTNGLWSVLGLVYEGDSSRAATVASNTATLAGVYQPRSIFVFERAEFDDGNAEEPTHYRVIPLKDGTIKTYESGRHLTRRRMGLIDVDEDIGGRPAIVGRAASLNADRVTLNINNPTLLTSNISSPYVDTGTAAAGRYLSVAGLWVSRIRSASASSIVLAEKIPSSITVPSGAPLTQISEAHALWFEALRTGYFLVYSTNDAMGALKWVSEEYALADAQLPSSFAPRRDFGSPLYSPSWELVRRDSPELTLIS